MRRSTDFASAVRRGRRVKRGALVIHQLRDAHDGAPAVVGFVVSKAVGGSVTRHRVARQLRHLVVPRLVTLPPGSATVVRALPDAAGASSTSLDADLGGALERLQGGGR
jgi:ribonuclease P protein component